MLLGKVVMNAFKNVKRSILALLLSLCGACGSNAANNSDQAHTHKHEAASSDYQKPGANIQLITRKIDIAEAGSSTLINLELWAGYPAGQIAISLGSSEVVNVLGAQEFQTVLFAGRTITWPIDIYTPTTGIHYLPVYAEVALPSGQTVHRAFSLVVQVGSDVVSGQKSDSDRSSVSDHKGKAVKVLPATEEIK